MLGSLSLVVTDTLRQILQLIADLVADSSEIDCSFREVLFTMAKEIITMMFEGEEFAVEGDTLRAVLLSFSGSPSCHCYHYHHHSRPASECLHFYVLVSLSKIFFMSCLVCWSR